MMSELSATQRRDLMEIVDDRHDRGSIILASQIPLTSWHRAIGDSTYAEAILDRIVHAAYRIELQGDSLRKPARGGTAPLRQRHRSTRFPPRANNPKVNSRQTPTAGPAPWGGACRRPCEAPAMVEAQVVGLMKMPVGFVNMYS
jgi:hypothetical protein